jgi:hypothetical protein
MRPVYAATKDPPAPAQVRRLTVFCVLALLALSPLRAWAADTRRPDVPIPAGPNADDCRLTLLALQALTRDEHLGTLNLGLTVHDTILTLWGPVPSAACAQRAVVITRQVPGVGGIVNQLTILPPEEFPAPSAASFPPGPSRRSRESVGDHHPLTPGLAGRPDTHRPVPGDGLDWRPPSPTERRAGPGSGSGSSARLGRPIPILPPLVIRVPAPAPNQPPAGLTTATAQPAAVNGMAGLDRLVRADPRYRQLRPEVRGRDVYLHGVAYSLVDLHTLARAIAQVPGVGRVILDDVQVAGGR